MPKDNTHRLSHLAKTQHDITSVSICFAFCVSAVFFPLCFVVSKRCERDKRVRSRFRELNYCVWCDGKSICVHVVLALSSPLAVSVHTENSNKRRHTQAQKINKLRRKERIFQAANVRSEKEIETKRAKGMCVYSNQIVRRAKQKFSMNQAPAAAATAIAHI